MQRLVKKNQALIMMQENVLARTRGALRMESLDQVYTLHNIEIPDKVRVA